MIACPGCAACGQKRDVLRVLPLCGPCARKLACLNIPARGYCPACLSRLSRAGRCRACASKKPLIDRTFAPFLYQGVVRGLVIALKFNGDLRAAPLLSSAMNRALAARDCDLVVPVPRSKARERERGFNQAALIAAPIADALGAPLLDLLERTKNTKRQSSLRGTAARHKNVDGAFRAKASIQGRRVLLTDDVRTSGATANACARALLDAGAKRVTLLVAAVAPNAGRAQRKYTWKERLT